MSTERPGGSSSCATRPLIDEGEDREEDSIRRYRACCDHMTIEPMMFLQMCASACSSIVLQNMYIDRICRINMNYNETVCQHLTDRGNTHIEDIVDRSAANYGLVRKTIEAVLPILLSIFLGPWTDKNGNKNTMLLPIFGYILSGALYIMYSFLPDSPPEYLFVCSIPVALTGGMVFLVSSAYSFIAKITTTENRSFSIAVLQVCWLIGGPVGALIGNQIFQIFGFPAVFITSTALYAISFIYGIIYIKETIPQHNEESTDFFRHEIQNDESNLQHPEFSNTFYAIFNLESVKDMFGTLFKPREGFLRSLIWVLIFAMCLLVFTLFGMDQMVYLFVRKRFHWRTTQYSIYMAVDIVLQIIGGGVMAMITMKIFKVDDAKIGLFSSAGYCAAAVVVAFACSWWMMYLGTAIKMFCGLITVIIRSLLSKCVDREELGKIFAFLASAEDLMPLIGNIVYTNVFRSTVAIFPGAMYLISAGMHGLIFLSFLWIVLKFDLERSVSTSEGEARTTQEEDNATFLEN